MFASGMGYRDIASHVEEIYDHKYQQQKYQVLLTNYYQQSMNGVVVAAICVSNSVDGWDVFLRSNETLAAIEG